MWCDDFDMDLYNVMPEMREVMEPAAKVVLWTHCNPTDDQLNCPCAWNSDEGLRSFFTFEPDDLAKQGVGDGQFYWTRDPIVRCTWEEIVRDLWVHQQIMCINTLMFWRPDHLKRQFEKIMYDLRGWREYEKGEIEEAKKEVREHIADATRRLLIIVARRGDGRTEESDRQGDGRSGEDGNRGTES